MISFQESVPVSGWYWRGGGLSSRHGLYGPDGRPMPQKSVVSLPDWLQLMNRVQAVVFEVQHLPAAYARVPGSEGLALLARALTERALGVRQRLYLDVDGIVVDRIEVREIEDMVRRLEVAFRDVKARAHGAARAEADEDYARTVRGMAVVTGGSHPLVRHPGVVSSREAVRLALVHELARLPQARPSVGHGITPAPALPVASPLHLPVARPPRT